MRPMRVVAALGAALCLAGPSQAASATAVPDRVVFPTGEWPADVENVQAALDQGGTVLLKAADASGRFMAFDFGPTLPGGGSVNLTTDVRLRGETVQGHMTTIRGGYFPILGTVPVRATISGIHFDGSGQVAIVIVSSSGLEITGNLITNVVGDPDFGEAIGIFTWSVPSPEDISGTILIADNVIAVDPGGVANSADGVVVAGAVADVSVIGNRITGAHRQGMLMYRTGRVSVLGNLVVPGAGNPDIEFGNGVVVNSPLEDRVLIRDNTVMCANPFADGIILMERGSAVSGAVIDGNVVVMHGSVSGAISLYGAVGNSRVRSNRIWGDGAYALQVAQLDPGAMASSNRFLGNNLSGFTSSVADVFFDVNTGDNLLVGRCASVLDLGTNNHTTCGHGPAAVRDERPPRSGRSRGRDVERLTAVARAIAAVAGR
jgi:hypothetical protein